MNNFAKIIITGGKEIFVCHMQAATGMQSIRTTDACARHQAWIVSKKYGANTCPKGRFTTFQSFFHTDNKTVTKPKNGLIGNFSGLKAVKNPLKAAKIPL